MNKQSTNTGDRYSNVRGKRARIIACTSLISVLLELGISATALADTVPVLPPSFTINNAGFYCSVTWPNAGGSYIVLNPGNIDKSPCSPFPGSRIRRTGLFTTDYWNIAEGRCDPNYYWIYQLWGGLAAISSVTNSMANQATNGNCYFKVTIGGSVRGPEDSIGPIDYFADTKNSWPIPNLFADPHTGKVFNAAYFQNQIKKLLMQSPPAGYSQPVGYQVSLRAPLGSSTPSPAPLNSGVSVDFAVGNVAGYRPLPPGSTSGMGNPLMDVDRRFDSASTAKTITAVAIMAAFEELAEHGNPQKVTLESSINPYLQMIWPGGVHPSVQKITFRDLLRHTTPLCSSGRQGGDRYSELKLLMSQAPNQPDGNWQPGPTAANVGVWHYCNSNYALLRILLPLLIEGRAAFENPNGSLRTDDEIDQLTALSYRNYVRGRIFAPIGLPDVDVFYRGPSPETIYFCGPNQSCSDGIAIPDKVNIGVGGPSYYDQRSNTTVRSPGSGFWYLSAKEYSLFIANLWAGRIISETSIRKMLTPYSLGFQLGSLPKSGKATWGKEGGGWAGAPSNQWVTFPDGYTAVIQTNSSTPNLRQFLEQTYEDSWQ